MKPESTIEKTNLHPKNKHIKGYDFKLLIEKNLNLKQFVILNPLEIETIDFSNPEAVKELNRALLYTYYDVTFWDIPIDYLCPPIPGRADYILYIADLLAKSNQGKIPIGEQIMGLDVGIGANCIYPIIGNALFEWSFVGTDIDEDALQNCKKIIGKNLHLIDAVSMQLQLNSRYIFKDIILPEDRFTFTMCNPPYHTSQEEATKEALRKVNNLEGTNKKETSLNFGGKNNELWCDGGELAFIQQMIFESAKYPLNCFWFTTLISRKEHLKSILKTLNKVSPVEVKTIEMAQGQKISRFVAWTFLSEKQQQNWKF